MLAGKPFAKKIHKNRNKEFFLEITGKYEVLSRNSFSRILPLIYRNTAPSFTNITRGCLPLKVELNTQKAAPDVYTINNYNIRNISIYAKHATAEKQHVVQGEKKAPYYAEGSNTQQTHGSSSKLFANGRNMIDYIKEDKIPEKPLNGDIANFIGVNGIVRHDFDGNRNSESKRFSNAFLRGLQKNQAVIGFLSHNVHGIAALTEESNLHSRRLVNKNDDHQGIVHVEEGSPAPQSSLYRDRPGMEFAKIQYPKAADEKDELSIQNTAASGENKMVMETALDMNKLASQVYKELERKIRIERERRGL